MAQIIQQRRGNASLWTSSNPVLAEGEVGLELDTGKRKTGDGVTAWDALAYEAVGGGSGLTDITESLVTASPNATVNVSQLEVTGGTTNTDLALAPRGTGAFIAGVKPDSTSTGGNKRGAYAADLQIQRNAAAKVASGANSFQAGKNNTTSSEAGATLGEGNTTSGTQGAFTVGYGNTNSCKQGMVLGGISTCTSEYNQAIGYSNSNTGYASFLAGGWCTNTGQYNATLGMYAANTRNGTFVFAGGRFGATGDAQFSLPILRGTTTNDTPTELFLQGSSRFTVPASGVVAGTISIVGTKTDGSAIAHYVRQVCLKNVAGTTSEVFSPLTIGTDNAAGTSIAITANDANDAIKIEVTGIADQNWRWQAVCYFNDLKYA